MHRIINDLQRVVRVAPRELPKCTTPQQKQGLSYEKKVKQLIKCHIAPELKKGFLDNPWFDYYDKFGAGTCVPDFICPISDECVIVGEVKLTYVPEAWHKLQDLYCPIVNAYTRRHCYPLIVCKNLIPGAPKAENTVTKALRLYSGFKTIDDNTPCVLQYLNNGPLLW